MQPLPGPADQVRVKYIKVTNNGSQPFTDMHDGVPIKIMPGKSDNYPLDMAAHIWGYVPGVDPAAMMRHTCRRQGWNTIDFMKPGDGGKTLAEERFSALKIEEVTYRLAPVEATDTTKPIPADPEVPRQIDAPEDAIEVPRTQPRRVEVRA